MKALVPGFHMLYRFEVPLAQWNYRVNPVPILGRFQFVGRLESFILGLGLRSKV